MLDDHQRFLATAGPALLNAIAMTEATAKQCEMYAGRTAQEMKVKQSLCF